MTNLHLFTIPKAFDPRDDYGKHIDMIQRNAIENWIALNCESKGIDITITILGDDPGVRGVFYEYSKRDDIDVGHVLYVEYVDVVEPAGPSVRHVMEIADLFGDVDGLGPASPDLVCYVNTDIMFCTDFLDTVAVLDRVYAGRQFLAVGQRHDVAMNQRWTWEIDPRGEAGEPRWEFRLKKYTGTFGRLHGIAGIDWFLHRPGLWGKQCSNIPDDLVLGRGYWDNFLVGDAVLSGHDVIDCTLTVTTVHQGHHVPWMAGNWDHPAILHNKRIVEAQNKVYYINRGNKRTIRIGNNIEVRDNDV